jgi:hypothetical protein
MSKLDLDALERTARAAQTESPGPWVIRWTDEAMRRVDWINDVAGDSVVVGDSGIYPPHGDAARHIAANSPPVTRALLARIRELEDDLRGWLEAFGDGPEDFPETRKLLEKGVVLP